MPESLVSIIIPCFNAEKTLDLALKSVLDQTHSNIELIVVDDGSSDGSAEICRSYGDRIKWIKQTNSGASAARNNGIRNATGEFIGFLDADDVYLPNKIERLLKVFEQCPNAGIVSGAFVQIMSAGRFLTPQPGLVFPDGAKQGYIDYFELEASGAWVIHTNTVLIKRAVLDEVGLFNPSFKFGEDVDLWCRIAGRFPVAFLDEPVAEYDRANENSLCSNASVLEHGVEYLYDRKQERLHIVESKLASYRKFKNGILYGRLMLSIYEKDRRMLMQCMRKLHFMPFNIRVLLALMVLPFPVSWWPRNRRA